jgi:3-oxoacyl-[acyl-carrier protein] reductase
MTHTLQKKVALVTGGARGIGAAIVRRLSEEGATVVFTYSRSAERAEALAAELNASGRSVLALQADAADSSAVSAAVQTTIERYGRIDILVNNAGVLIPIVIDEVEMSDFEQQFAVNVRGVFVATRDAVRHMKDGGRIIMIGSVAAERAGFAGYSIYGMTKAAISAFTRGLARDLGPRGITVNTIQPGPTASDMTAGMEDAITPLVAVGRMGKDIELAALAAFLAGPEAAFITGATLTHDGGFLA